MSVITLYKRMDVPAVHGFNSLAEKSLQLLERFPEFESATFECDGVTVPVYKGRSFEEVHPDFCSLRARLLTGGRRRSR